MEGNVSPYWIDSPEWEWCQNPRKMVDLYQNPKRWNSMNTHPIKTSFNILYKLLKHLHTCVVAQQIPPLQSTPMPTLSHGKLRCNGDSHHTIRLTWNIGDQHHVQHLMQHNLDLENPLKRPRVMFSHTPFLTSPPPLAYVRPSSDNWMNLKKQER